MHFETVIKHLLLFFKEHDIQYALIGGISLGMLGVQRTTVDLDFLILVDDIDIIDRYLTTHGYTCLIKDQNFSSYTSKNPILGRIDFMFATKEQGQKMLERSIKKRFSKELKSINVVRPEDLIGLKLQAIYNNSKRLHKDTADIESLFKIYGKKLDYDLLEDYFKMYSEIKKLKDLWEDAVK